MDRVVVYWRCFYDRYINRWMNGILDCDGCDGWMDGWADVWMIRYMTGWIDVYMYGWMG